MLSLWSSQPGLCCALQRESEPGHNPHFSLAWETISGAPTGDKTPLPAALRCGLLSCSWRGHFNPQQHQEPRSGASVSPAALGVPVTPCPLWDGGTTEGLAGDSSLARLLSCQRQLWRPDMVGCPRAKSAVPLGVPQIPAVPIGCPLSQLWVLNRSL